MTGILVKACTNCGGDVNCLEEIDGLECRCLQCGRPMEAKVALSLLKGSKKTAA